MNGFVNIHEMHFRYLTSMFYVQCGSGIERCLLQIRIYDIHQTRTAFYGLIFNRQQRETFNILGRMSLVDVFVGNFPQIDWTLYTLWVEGLSESEAMQNLKKRGLVSSQAEYCTDGAENILLASDVADNYRLFGLWESMLHQPVTFSEQLVFQLDPSTQHKLVEQYYALDNSVARELLGRKLTSRLRKDLDEIADKTGVSLRSCRRQFDNIKRVM